jgi:ABC-type methionine transport system ATPase subunit
MNLLKDLNRSQGTTFLVVTHDLSVARQTRRILVMADGKIIREDIIGSPLEEDLKIWQHSGLGQRILSGDLNDMKGLSLTDKQVELLRVFLSQNSTAA